MRRTRQSDLSSIADKDVMQYLSGGAQGYGWDDLLGVPTVYTPGASDPVWSIYRGNIKQFQFSQVSTNEMWFNYHIPHRYKPLSDIHLHVHWSQIVVDTGGTAGAPGNVKWYFDVTYAKGHQQQAFAAPVTTSIVQQGSTTQYQHMLAEVQLSALSPSASQINSNDIEPDGVVLVRCYRNPADAADTLNQSPFLHYVDIHIQVDRANTRNKAPNFYL